MFKATFFGRRTKQNSDGFLRQIVSRWCLIDSQYIQALVPASDLRATPDIGVLIDAG